MRIVLLAALFLASAQTAHAQVNIENVLVGFTSTQHPRTAGYLAYTAACQAEFPNTRMCTSEDIMSTRRVPAGLTGTAWTRAVISVATNSLFDASGNGVAAGGCGFSDAALLVSSASGQLSGFASCQDLHRVACCGLPVDPAQGDLDQDGAATLRDEAIFRRILAGLPILLGASGPASSSAE